MEQIGYAKMVDVEGQEFCIRLYNLSESSSMLDRNDAFYRGYVLVNLIVEGILGFNEPFIEKITTGQREVKNIGNNSGIGLHWFTYTNYEEVKNKFDLADCFTFISFEDYSKNQLPINWRLEETLNIRMVDAFNEKLIVIKEEFLK